MHIMHITGSKLQITAISDGCIRLSTRGRRMQRSVFVLVGGSVLGFEEFVGNQKGAVLRRNPIQPPTYCLGGGRFIPYINIYVFYFNQIRHDQYLRHIVWGGVHICYLVVMLFALKLMREMWEFWENMENYLMLGERSVLHVTMISPISGLNPIIHYYPIYFYIVVLLLSHKHP